MKKVIFENGLKAFLATAFLLLLGVGSVMAQGKLTAVPLVPGVTNPPVTSLPLYDVPQGVFVNTQDAIAKLDVAILDLKAQLEAAMQNPAVFNALLVKYNYFVKIQEYLKQGATTPNAIAAGLWIFLADEMDFVSPAERAQLKQDAINLLS